jgi:hypothetical protein
MGTDDKAIKQDSLTFLTPLASIAGRTMQVCR